MHYGLVECETVTPGVIFDEAFVGFVRNLVDAVVVAMIR
jgi:hypothetical protein